MRIPYLLPLLVVSASYMLAFALTDLIVTPVQGYFLPEVTKFASLVFLPHGVRVLTGWLYGWKSLPLLAPASYACGLYYYGYENFTLALALAGIAGVVAAAVAFDVFARLGHDFRYVATQNTQWRDVLLVGAGASVVNSFGIEALSGSDFGTTIVRLLGDFVGLSVCLFILMHAFRLSRRLTTQ